MKKDTDSETGNKYEISSLNDFLNVPADRLVECLTAFNMALMKAREIRDGIAKDSYGEGMRLRRFVFLDDGSYTASEIEFILPTGKLIRWKG